MDEPSVDALQALVLLVIAFTAAGKGKKTYMLMSMFSLTALSSCVLADHHSSRRGHGHGPGASPRDGLAGPSDAYG